MLTFVTVLHCFIALLLVVLFLIQDSKSDGALGVGGGSKSLLGATGAQTLASKMTVTAAIIFSITSLSLASMTSGGKKSVVDGLPAATAVPNTAAPIDATAPAAATPAATSKAPEATAPVKGSPEAPAKK